MTWALTSSPLALAAWAPASTAARTEPTSPRTKVVTKALPICTWPASVMLAALHIASVAAMVAIRPLVSTRPRASWLLPLRRAFVAMNGFLGGLAAGGGRLIRLFLARQGQHDAQVLVRPRDDLHADDLADAAGGGGAGIDRCLDRGDVADHKGRHHTAADLAPVHQRHVGGLHHGIAGLNQR